MPMPRSVPAMVKRPAENSMSPSPASRTCGRDLAALCDDALARLDHRGSARHDRLRTTGATARDQPVAVALHQPDALERNAKPARQELRQRRPVALSVIEGAGDDGDGAVALEMDAAHLVRRRRRDFEIAADAAAAQLAGGEALQPALFESVPVRGLDCAREEAREVAGIVGRADRRRVRQFLRPDLVAPAQFDRIDADLPRRGVDEPFHVVVALRPAGAAIGADRRSVGEDAARRHLHQRRAVGADAVLGDVEGRHHRPERRQVCAHVAEPGDAHGKEAALAVEGEFGMHGAVPAVMIGGEAFGARVGPLDGPLQHPRGMQDGDVFGEHRRLHAERAADMAGQNAHILRLCAEHECEIGPHPEDALRRGAENPALRPLVPFADRRARLHRVDDNAVVDEVDCGDVRRLREGGIDRRRIAEQEVEGHVAGRLVVELRRAFGDGVLKLHHGRQRLDVEHNGFGGIAGRGRCLGDDKGDRIADIAHPVDGQGRPRRLPHRRAVPVLAREPARQEAVPGRHDIPPGHNSENAGHRHRRLAVDAAEDAVGVGAADEDAVSLARHGEIVGVAALAAHEGRVLVAGHRLADAELGEGEIVQDERLVQCGDPLADGALGLAVGRSRSAPAAASGPGNPLI